MTEEDIVTIGSSGRLEYDHNIFSSSWNLNSNSTSSTSTSTSTSTSNSNSNSAEFMAFVGWYAFLVACCVLPMACAAYHRRRRNAMIALLGGEDMERTRSRMSDIERGRIAGGGWSSDDAGVNGSGVGMMGTMGEGVNLDDPENRDREW